MHRETSLRANLAAKSKRRRIRRAKPSKESKPVYDSRERAAGAETEDRRDEIADYMREEKP